MKTGSSSWCAAGALMMATVLTIGTSLSQPAGAGRNGEEDRVAVQSNAVQHGTLRAGDGTGNIFSPSPERPADRTMPTNLGPRVEYQPPQVGQSPPVSGRSLVFDLSPGAAYPPETLGPYMMTRFRPHNRDLPPGSNVRFVRSPCEAHGTEGIRFSIPLSHRRVQGACTYSWWATWGHEYIKDVYYTRGATQVTIDLPPDVYAFYFYVAPNPYRDIAFTVWAGTGQTRGLSSPRDGASTGSFIVNGDHGAAYVGVYGRDLEWVTIATDDGVTDFAIGEFGMTCASRDEYVACCIEATGACTDGIDVLDCIEMGGRYEVGVALCADLDPPCGTLLGACCMGAEPDPGYEPWECVGEMTQLECLTLGEETNWNEGESCTDPGFECPGTPTYCPATGGCYEHISRVQIGDIDNASDCTGYSNYTSLWTVVLRGVDHALHIENAWEGWPADRCSVWVDWNQDKAFDDDPASDECYGDLQGDGEYNFTIDVPLTALPGYTRMRLRVDYAEPEPVPCGDAWYGEVEDYTLLVSGDAPAGSCCDPYTGDCEDNVLGTECLPPLEFSHLAQCAELDPACGNPGACCDPYTGGCSEDVVEHDCQSPLQHAGGATCAELDPACGNPGACCDDQTATCWIEYELNCVGFSRFLPGAQCDPDPFDPPCGEWPRTGLLYCPSEPDNPTFRAALAAELPDWAVDYFDAREDTPTLEELTQYGCVFTWVNYAYADEDAMCEVLADFVDVGGRVILGQWCLSLAGGAIYPRILGPDYCPAMSTFYSSDAYAGDGSQCPTLGVESFSSSYFDQTTAYPGALVDGTTNNGYDFITYYPSMSVFYSPGNTGLDYTNGDVVRLTANMCICTGEPMYGACCDITTGECVDNVQLTDCVPLQFHWNDDCAELEPACGNPGACCDDWAEPPECLDGVMEVNCEHRFDAGGTCDELEPPCGEYLACEHKVTMWDSYGDGWNDGYIDIYIGGTLLYPGVTLASGSGPEDFVFDAATDDEIITVFTAGGWPDEASYCIYDVTGGELGCDGLDGVEPTGITVAGYCGEPGACCDPYTGVCLDNMIWQDCLAPLQHFGGDECAELNPECGNPGACCEPYTGDCVDDVLQANCEFDHYPGEECGELDPPCGNPGCCCEHLEFGWQLKDPVLAYELNCVGRFLPGVLGEDCAAEAFEPACGLWAPAGVLYCPAHADNATFRAMLSEELSGTDVDYFDARVATPTLAELMQYRTVLTWVNYAYADKVAMGDVLADFADLGGYPCAAGPVRVILGQWCLPTAGNYLAGRIMTDEGYCPATATFSSSDSYAGDGFMCWTLGVESFSSSYFDQTTSLEWTSSDGTTTNGYDFISLDLWWEIAYSPGNTGLDFTTGDVVRLIANLCSCSAGWICGACCDPYTGECEDDVDLMDCLSLEFHYAKSCDGTYPPDYPWPAIDPPCGGLFDLGDLNCDGSVDFFDIGPFVVAIMYPELYPLEFLDCDIMLADCNGDGVVDFFDIDAFVALITGGG